MDGLAVYKGQLEYLVPAVSSRSLGSSSGDAEAITRSPMAASFINGAFALSFATYTVPEPESSDTSQPSSAAR